MRIQRSRVWCSFKGVVASARWILASEYLQSLAKRSRFIEWRSGLPGDLHALHVRKLPQACNFWSYILWLKGVGQTNMYDISTGSILIGFQKFICHCLHCNVRIRSGYYTLRPPICRSCDSVAHSYLANFKSKGRIGLAATASPPVLETWPLFQPLSGWLRRYGHGRSASWIQRLTTQRHHINHNGPAWRTTYN